ncbi:protein kinase domain-containing protein [Mycolicibacterium llatzerense]|uniref:protein kinase domain-containing protein n=1 Tax=Mycolicibacterium llatzerense TaxID=280871 RepID=UPI0013A6A66C|nr:protein kinase [Mycolicibacterium llatzerense]
MAGGGQCRWAFATKDGEEFFLKEFLTPTYPLPSAPGSEATKRRKLAKCNTFMDHHVSIMKALNGAASTGGNLVTTKDFFRHEARFYKVTDKVDVSTLPVGDVHKLDQSRRLILASTVAHSLEILHRASLVHGDLKPPNVLLKSTTKNHFAAKLIDFDDAYFVGKPAPPEELVGDMAYYSPETQLYVREETGPAALKTSSDIFALGILFTEYFTGHKPLTNDSQTCATAVLKGAPCSTGLEKSWPQMDALIKNMMRLDSSARPPIGEVKASLKSMLHPTAPKRGPEPDPPAPGSGGSRLRGRLVKDASDAKSSPTPTPTPTPRAPGAPSRLRGDLISRRGGGSTERGR